MSSEVFTLFIIMTFASTVIFCGIIFVVSYYIIRHTQSTVSLTMFDTAIAELKHDKKICTIQLDALQMAHINVYRLLAELQHENPDNEAVSENMMELKAIGNHSVSKMYEALSTRMTLGDLRDLNFRLGSVVHVAHDADKRTAAEDIIVHMRNRGRFHELVEVVNTLRPDIDV